MPVIASTGPDDVGAWAPNSQTKGLDKEGSDLDLLVDLPPGTSLLRIVGLKLDIEDALGVKVDLCTESELHPDLKARILAEALPL